MYTYESFTNELLNSAKNASLDVYNIRNKIDIQTCTREFSCCFALSEKNHLSKIEPRYIFNGIR